MNKYLWIGQIAKATTVFGESKNTKEWVSDRVAHGWENNGETQPARMLPVVKQSTDLGTRTLGC